MLGTGALAFPVNLGLTVHDFAHHNMTDPQLCDWAKSHYVPMVCLIREEGFVREIASAQDTAIWKGVQHDDSKQTEIINSIKNFDRLPLPKEFEASKCGGPSLEWSHLKMIANSVKCDEVLLEFGSGLSTSYWYKRDLNFLSIEHDAKYAADNPYIIHCPIDENTGWYFQSDEFYEALNCSDVVLIDGPIGSSGERYNLPIELLNDKRLIWVDDVQREKDLKQAEAIAKAYNMKLTIYKGREKSIAKLERKTS